mmetsp:Transcript_25753/g.61161  ORF Transcript_25753/g.61161 Transcript_25753/m.61161 type:complete len:439 (+) Transcript_25753:348-1664(+)
MASRSLRLDLDARHWQTHVQPLSDDSEAAWSSRVEELEACAARLATGQRAPRSHRLRKRLQHLFGGVPVDAGVGDALAVLQRLPAILEGLGLVARHQIRLHHHSQHRPGASGDLAREFGSDEGLVGVEFLAVAMRAVHHHAAVHLGLVEACNGSSDRAFVVVGRIRAAAEDEVTVFVAFRRHDRHRALEGDREEAVGVLGSADGVQCNLHIARRAILEADGHRQARGQLSVHLALCGPRSDGTPRYQVCDVLGGDGVEELTAAGQPQLVDLQQQPAGELDALVDVARAVEVRVVDQTLPADGGARLLEVDAHHYHQLSRMLFLQLDQAASVLHRTLDVMDGARADDHNQAVISAVDDVLHLLPRLCYRRVSVVGVRVFREDCWRYDGVHIRDSRIHDHGAFEDVLANVRHTRRRSTTSSLQLLQRTCCAGLPSAGAPT